MGNGKNSDEDVGMESKKSGSRAKEKGTLRDFIKGMPITPRCFYNVMKQENLMLFPLLHRVSSVARLVKCQWTSCARLHPSCSKVRQWKL